MNNEYFSIIYDDKSIYEVTFVNIKGKLTQLKEVSQEKRYTQFKDSDFKDYEKQKLDKISKIIRLRDGKRVTALTNEESIDFHGECNVFDFNDIKKVTAAYDLLLSLINSYELILYSNLRSLINNAMSSEYDFDGKRTVRFRSRGNNLIDPQVQLLLLIGLAMKNPPLDSNWKKKYLEYNQEKEGMSYGKGTLAHSLLKGGYRVKDGI